MVETPPSRPMAGILWMLVTGLCFVAVTALVKFLGPRIPAAEAAFLRYLVGFVFLIPVLGTLRKTPLSARHHKLFAARGVMHAAGVGLWFFAMTQIPLAEVTAMNYLSPVFVTLGAAVFLGERLALRRIAAIVAALVGAAVILRPGIREVSPGHLAMLGAGLVFGGSYLLTKVMTNEIKPALIVAMLSIWVTAGLAPFAAMVWVTPTLYEMSILLGVAFFATAGHYTMTLALAAAPIAVTQPVTFLQLIWATAIGAVFFAEPVDFWVVLGGTLILASISFIAWREAIVSRRSITPPAPATKM